MASNIENLPRIIKDIQDITSQLFEEFSSTGDPVTDDNHVLHRLCMKLEYLLQTCMKEKSLLAGSKSYWHWMYDSLKKKKGLSDGLKFVCANKEVHTSRGRGRALIRYSLVHQTLADSFQNCLMSADICMQYLKPHSTLMNQINAETFLTALYDLNAVNFDLLSIGYDLDAAWPSFASKRYSSNAAQWQAPTGRSSSLGSLNSFVSHVTTTSLMMDNPSIRGLQHGGSFVGCSGPGSTGTHSVDQRVEELVLELSESDQKIQEQQEIMNGLECQAENLSKSACEKQDILARVISDLESRNQNLQEGMSQMSNEFQNREQLWQSKHAEVMFSLKETEEVNKTLKSKISLLEEDKRNLEDTVSARMSHITSGFSGTNTSNKAEDYSVSKVLEMEQHLERATTERMNLEKQINQMTVELSCVPEKIESEKQALKALLKAEFEGKLESTVGDVTNNFVLQFSSLLPGNMNDSLVKFQSPDKKVEFILTKLSEMTNESDLRRTSSILQQDQIQMQSYDERLEYGSNELLEECNAIKAERDEALADTKDLSEKLVTAEEESQNYQLRLEAVERTVVDLRDENFCLQQEIESEKKHRQETLEDMRSLQSKYEAKELELTGYMQSCNKLQDDIDIRERKEIEVRREFREQTVECAKLSSELSLLQHELESVKEKHQDLSLENGRLEQEKQNSIETAKNSERWLELFQQEINQLKQQKDSLEEILSLEKSSSVEHIQQCNAEFSTELQNNKLELKKRLEELKDVEMKYRLLAGNLSEKEKELSAVKFQSNTEMACMSEEMLKIKKDIQELSGENNSHKRMIKSFEKKIELLEQDNRELITKTTNLQDLKERLLQAEQSRDSLMESVNANEEELISVMQSLENERDAMKKLRDEMSDGLLREEKLKSELYEVNSVSDEMKAKLIQLLQEKDALWKECDELRYFQKLQEEGERTEGKWMEDQETRYCLHCGTEFTFIIRKHHCRTCGKIFCNNCSKQWVITKNDGKHERCCLSCLEQLRNKHDIHALTSSIPSVSIDSATNSPAKANETPENDEEFDDITEEDLNEVSNSDSMYEKANSTLESSIYTTPDSPQKSTVGDHTSDEEMEGNPDDNCEVLVLAGESIRVPVQINSPGTSLLWNFSTDRSIDFQLTYCQTEGEEEQILISKCRCNSHSEPVKGEILSKKSGVYTLEFDNKFSRLMSKTVKYTLCIKKA